MRQKMNFPELVNAKQAFFITAKQYGDYKSNTEITDFLGSPPSALNYAERVAYKLELNKIITEAEDIIKTKSRSDKLFISRKLKRLPSADKISIANNIISSLPVHKRAFITL